MSVQYDVHIRFVDSSYWDDGSRYTSRHFRFAKLQEAISFAREVLAKGCEVKGREDKLFVHPNADDITIERTSKVDVKWKAEACP